MINARVFEHTPSFFFISKKTFTFNHFESFENLKLQQVHSTGRFELFEIKHKKSVVNF